MLNAWKEFCLSLSLYVCNVIRLFPPCLALDKPDGEEGNTTEEEHGVLYETADMIEGISQDTLQYSSNESAVTPCAS